MPDLADWSEASGDRPDADDTTTPPSASRQMIEIGRRMIANILADTTDLGEFDVRR